MEYKMIKVLHSVLSLDTGGLENGVVNLINHAPDDFQVDVLCLRSKGALAHRISEGRCQVLVSKTMDDHSIYSSFRGHYQALRCHEYHILHTHGWTTLLSGALAAWSQRLLSFKKQPLIVNGEHGVFYAESRKRRLIQQGLFQAIDGNLTVSADLGRRMESAFSLPPETFYPILNGVDIDRFKPNGELRAQHRAQLGYMETDFVIGTVGRLVEIKNYPLLIRVFAALNKQYSNIKLLFCGDGDQRANLEALVESYELSSNVQFTGRIDNVAQVMQAFDVFTLTSDMEGLPNTLLEAMASGIPSIVTDVGGSREVMPSPAGTLLPAGDEAALFKGLQRYIESQSFRESTAQEALGHVRRHLSIEAMVTKYYDYYRQLGSVNTP